MFNELESALIAGINNSRCNNNYAKGLLYFLVNNQDIPDIPQLVAIDSTSKIPNDSFFQRFEHIKSDYRLLRLDVKGIRKFPSDKWYTLNFNSGTNQPISSVFLGTNGAGKSSLFSALEYISLGHSYLADERGYTEANSQEQYMHHIDGAETSIIMHNVKDTDYVSLEGKKYLKHKITPAFFCSEYDIQEISRKGLRPLYIANQLGLYRFNRVVNKMQKLKTKYDEVRETYRLEMERIPRLQKRVNIIYFLSAIKYEHIKEIREFINSAYNTVSSNFVCRNINKLCKISKRYINSWRKYTKEVSSEIFNAILSEIQYVESELQRYKQLSLDENLVNSELALYIRDTLDIWLDEIKSAVSGENNLSVNCMKRLSAMEHELLILKDKTDFEKGKTPLLQKNSEDIIQFNETLEYLQQSYMALLNKHVQVINEVLPSIFQEYFKNDIVEIKAKLDEPISKNYSEVEDKDDDETDDNMYSIKVEIKVCNPSTVHSSDKIDSPRRFLNTFRFKLFCFLLKFALVCSTKKLYNINFPFVVDDVFDASDFDNRTGVGGLIAKMFDAHNTFDSLKSLPLQLIFFTQDNLIADSIKRELLFKGIDAKLSRIFDYCYAEKGDYIDEEQKYIKIEDIII